MSDIDKAIDRLTDAAVRAGFGPPPGPPRDLQAAVDKIIATVHPLRVPPDLIRLWQRVDLGRMAIQTHPHFSSLEFALDTWQTHNEVPDLAPRPLFPIGYESWSELLIELGHGDHDGGAVFAWDYTGCPFTLVFPTLLDYLDQLTTFIEIGAWERRSGPNGEWFVFDPEFEWESVARSRLQLHGPVDGYGLEFEIAEDFRAWPERWQLASGLTREGREPHGATTSAQALASAVSAGARAEGTVDCVVIGLASQRGGSWLDVRDESGTLSVYCPDAVSPYTVVMRAHVELDIVVPAGAGPTTAAGTVGSSIRAALASGGAEAAGWAAAAHLGDEPDLGHVAHVVGVRLLD